MPYLLTAILIALGLTSSVVLAVGVVRRARRTRLALGSASAGMADRTGLLRARVAAVRVAVGARSSQRNVDIAGVGSQEPDETGGWP